jgi:hypothetical protein
LGIEKTKLSKMAENEKDLQRLRAAAAGAISDPSLFHCYQHLNACFWKRMPLQHTQFDISEFGRPFAFYAN